VQLVQRCCDEFCQITVAAFLGTYVIFVEIICYLCTGDANESKQNHTHIFHTHAFVKMGKSEQGEWFVKVENVAMLPVLEM